MTSILTSILQACAFISNTKHQVTDLPSMEANMSRKVARKSINDEQSEKLMQEVLEIYVALSSCEHVDLKPRETINGLFSRLVEICTKTVSGAVTDKILSDPRITEILPSLHKICGIAESHLEAHWAELITGDPSTSHSPEDVLSRLQNFPYYQNYIDLTRMELYAINSLSGSHDLPFQKFTFIGSGPLPLTSLCICSSLSCSSTSPLEILNIDLNPIAITQSRTLCSLLGSSASGMRFHCAAADDPDLNLAGSDVVYLAALVGSTQEEKESLLEIVVGRMSEGSLLVVRSAERLRRLMYAEFDPTSEKVLKCLDICLAVHPYDHIVNSVIIGRVKARSSATGTK